MRNIDKRANIYDKEGNLIRHVDYDNKLHSYTVYELEDLLDKLSNDKDENGRIKDPNAVNNINAMLFQFYQKYGNPHAAEILSKLAEQAKERAELKPTSEQVQEALTELNEELNNGSTDDNNDDTTDNSVQ